MVNETNGFVTQYSNSLSTIEVEEPVKTMAAVSPVATGRLREGKSLNVNMYATKKTIAQGMLDIALLTANASQLKYIITVGRENHDFYDVMLGLIVTSLVLQIVVAVMFLVISIFNINRQEQERSADILNNIIVVVLFIITVLNVIINAFGIEHSNGEVERLERLKQN